MPPADISGRAPGPARSSCSLHAARLTTIRLDSSIQDATVPFPLQKRFLLVVSVLRVRLLPIIGGALRTGGGLTACRFAVLTDWPTL